MRISDWSSDVCSSDLVVGEKLHRQAVEDRRDEGIGSVQFHRVGGLLAGARETIGVRQQDHLAAARRHLLHVGGGLLEQRPRGGADDDRHVLVDEGDGAVLHLAGGVALGVDVADLLQLQRSEEHTSELQSLMRISYAVFCLKKKKNKIHK